MKFMHSLHLCIGLALPFSLHASTRPQPALDLSTPKENADALVEIAESDPSFAGAYIVTELEGQVYKVVDRRSEIPMPRTPGSAPASAALLAFVNGLSTQARAQLVIQVQFTYNKDGSIATENWTMGFTGSWQAQTGMGEANDKSHK